MGFLLSRVPYIPRGRICQKKWCTLTSCRTKQAWQHGKNLWMARHIQVYKSCLRGCHLHDICVELYLLRSITVEPVLQVTRGTIKKSVCMDLYQYVPEDKAAQFVQKNGTVAFCTIKITVCTLANKVILQHCTHSTLLLFSSRISICVCPHNNRVPQALHLPSRKGACK